jgi:hypothetical protein
MIIKHHLMIYVMRDIPEDYVNNVIYLYNQVIIILVVILSPLHLDVGNVKILNII